MGYIHICLDWPFQAMIKGLETNLWKMMATLNANLALKANMSKLMLLTQLINIKHKTREALNSYFGQIININTTTTWHSPKFKYNTMQPVIEVQTKIDLHDMMSQLCDCEVNLNMHSEQNKAANAMWHDKPDHVHSKHGGKGHSPSKQDKGGKHHGHSQKLSKGPKQGPQEGNETTSLLPQAQPLEEQVNTVANKTDQWYLDLGMTCHVTCHHKLLHNYQPSCSTVNLVLGNNFKCHVKGMVQ